MNKYPEVGEMVLQEINRQDSKWGADRLQHPFEWNAILTEETGEFAQAVLHDEYGGDHAGTALKEIIQVAAVAMQIANSILLKEDIWKDMGLSILSGRGEE